MLRIFTISMLFFACFTLFGQKKILGKPEKFLKPMFFTNNVADNQTFAETPSKLLSAGNQAGNLWLIVSDRQNNKCYQKPDQSAELTHTMEFKETAYVVEEKLEWVLIGKGTIENGKLKHYKELGWIQKSKVLLWSNALRDETPDGVIVKGFLLHRLEHAGKMLNKEKLKEIPIYPNPAFSKSEITKPIYNVYFVYKQEGDYFLIGPNNFFIPSDIDLIGWVSREKLIIWNSRLAAEPCYDQEAFSHRQQNLDKRIRGYKERPDAAKCTESNNCDDGVLWDNDPAKFKDVSDLAKGGKRHKGEVFRFPIIAATNQIYRSAAVSEIKTIGKKEGEIPEVKHADFLEAITKHGKKRENLNFFFVIEGTREMAAHKASILSAIENIEKDLPSFVKSKKYGAVIYNDVYQAKNNMHLKVIPLSQARESVIQSINDFNFDQGFDDTDKNTIVRHAMVQGLNKGKFSKDEINFIIVIGNGADFYYDKARNLTAEADGYGDFACHPCDVELNEKLEELEVNLLLVQPVNEATPLSERLLKDFRSRMLNASNSMYDKYSRLTQSVYKGTTVDAPDMAEIDASTNQFELQNGVLNMKIVRKANGILSMAEIMKETNEFVVTSFNKIDDLYKVVKKIAESDAPELQGTNEWSPAVLHIISKSAKPDILEEIAKQKIKLHHEIFLARPKGEHQPYSYCVFMPETELDEYIQQLGQLKRAALGTPDEQRSTLASTMESLVRKFNGDRLSMNQVQKTTIDEVRIMMAGIKAATNFELEDKLNFPISGIKDKKILSDAKLQEILGKFSKTLTSLNAIRAQGKSYDFSYSLNDDAVYYWIPVSSLF